MEENKTKKLQSKCDEVSFKKLTDVNNQDVLDFIAYAVELCNPDKVWVGDDSDEDAQYCRQLAIDNKEEIPLAIKELFNKEITQKSIIEKDDIETEILSFLN